jgi:hypothetical protein
LIAALVAVLARQGGHAAAAARSALTRASATDAGARLMDEDTLIATLANHYVESEITEDEIKRRTEQSGVVCGVWSDRTKPYNIDYEVLKGGEL